MSPIDSACLSNDSHYIKFLIGTGSEITKDHVYHAIKENHIDALYAFTLSTNKEILKMLLDYGERVENIHFTKTICDNHHYMYPAWCKMTNNYTCRHLASKEEINMAIGSGNRDALYHIMYRIHKVFEYDLLLKWGIDNNNVDYVKMLTQVGKVLPKNAHFMAACQRGNTEMVKELIKQGYHPDKQVVSDAYLLTKANTHRNLTTYLREEFPLHTKDLIFNLPTCKIIV